MKPEDLDPAITLCAQGKVLEAWGELTALKLQWNLEQVGRIRTPSVATMLERMARELRRKPTKGKGDIPAGKGKVSH